jgi:uncharacterized protein
MLKAANLLGNETSPYLVQHADNPVHWRAWNDESLAEAKALNKPILLSIGYAACHWCHVMAHESFEDMDTAEVMNRLFVNIKVDREERPDVDAIYMSALHQLGDHGGWPMTMFLTPDAEPFWGGTYFPKGPKYGRPGFIQVMTKISRIYADEPGKVSQNCQAVLERLNQQNTARDRTAITRGHFLQTGEKILSVSDPVNGGMRNAPKFPQTGMIETLWRCGQQSGNSEFQKTALFALERMALGGIYDHLAGGYSRYTVDERWLVPHFEKMLYDNALILNQMVAMWPAMESPILEKAIAETISWLERDMQIDGGGLASSYDADSEGEEGRFYVWSRAEVDDVLGKDDGEFFARHYDISENGNWEGKSIPNRLHISTLEDASTEARLRTLCDKLLEVRVKRVWPGLDDKILADWNGLAVTAIARASRIFEKDSWLKFATEIFDFVSESMTENDRLAHSTRSGKTSGQGMLADYANMTEAALTLFEATANRTYLEKAETWTGTVIQHFATGDGGFFMTADDASDLILRPRSAADDATPNGNGTMVRNFVRLGAITGNARYDEQALNVIEAFSGDIAANPLGHTGLMNGFDQINRQIQILGQGVIDLIRDQSTIRDQISKIPYPIVLRDIKDNLMPQGNVALNALTEHPDGIHICVPGACLPPAKSAEETAERLSQAGTIINAR